MSLEDIVKSLATSTQAFQNETKASIKSLEQQVSQLANSMSKMESQGKLPAQIEKNPKHNASAITLRSGKAYDGSRMPEDEEDELEVKKDEATSSNNKKQKQVQIEAQVTPPPFPSRLRNMKREKEDEEILELFRKVEAMMKPRT
ncbi:hypothetical protein L2E82_38167 [Cichorium intybus]|uniref:Uncharacterized protein n=1 Tax=Cichorium intybus TaxID=13427 RepID=A0ACB9AGH8_CICIN|nr:hypothetical protein L2E82_38167 [Cichorium intybus]